jgi:NADH:ubiquinone oxidoreductase subunit 4 (subunit M)
MNVSLLLVILLAGALITYFSSEKLARQVALFVSLVAFVATGVLLSQFQ